MEEEMDKKQYIIITCAPNKGGVTYTYFVEPPQDDKANNAFKRVQNKPKSFDNRQSAERWIENNNLHWQKMEGRNVNGNLHGHYKEQIASYQKLYGVMYCPLIAEGKYKNGLKDGVWAKYDIKGKSSETTYKNGQKNGEHKEYFFFGGRTRLASKTMYENDAMNGLHEEYSDGKIIIRGHHRNNKKHGEWNWYDKGSMRPRRTENYDNGVKHGYFYHEPGHNSVRTGHYKNGIEQGTWTAYYAYSLPLPGNPYRVLHITSNVNYKDGKLQGLCTFYDEDGNATEKTYNEGRELASGPVPKQYTP
jgi:antitoxin component YwqK of YwqJK toxin-antitoxin module